MEKCEILKTIWKEKSINLIDETILLENTFMQQTSGHENLWKVQIGITRNYLIFLKCEVDLRMKVFELTGDSRIVIHMCPFNSLTVQMLPRRKMKISFPDESKCFYKLPLDFGCGSSWSIWKNIPDIKPSKKHNYRSRWALIHFATLDSDVQNYLRTEKFLRPPKILTEILSLSESGDDEIENETSIDHLSNIICQPSHHLSNFYCARDHLLKEESLDEVSQDVRHLPCHSFKAQASLPEKDSAGIKSEQQKRKLIAGDRVLEIEKPREEEKPTKGLEYKPKTGRGKGARKTRKVLRFGEGIPEGCTFDLNLSYSDSVSEEEPSNSKKIVKKESIQMSTYDYFIDEKMALKEISCSEDVMPVTGETSSAKNNLYQTLEMARYCPSISTLTVSGREIRRSQSVDSIFAIESTLYHLGYLKANLSLPNMDEILFHRRTHRLAYNTGFVRSLPEVDDSYSFWIPKGENGKSCGRVYNPTTISHKMEILKLKCKLIRNHIQSSFSQKIHDSQGTHENGSESSSSRSEDYADEHTCGKGKVDLGFTKKLLDEMETEYPARHSLWIESPDKNNPKADSSSQVSEKRITEVDHEMVAHGLKGIQQDLFYKIESSELARYILKPRTVNEVNSSYLCGYLYFYERMKHLVISELLAETNTSEMAEVFCYFVKVAYFCLHLRDKQSTSAILSGLCSPAILKHQLLWSTLFEKSPNEMM